MKTLSLRCWVLTLVKSNGVLCLLSLLLAGCSLGESGNESTSTAADMMSAARDSDAGVAYCSEAATQLGADFRHGGALAYSA